MVLYIVHDGIQTRFTQVAAARDVSIEIPANLQGQMGVIRLAARRIGGTDSYVSPEIVGAVLYPRLFGRPLITPEPPKP